MSEQDYEQLTLFPEDSRASRLVLPGSAEARKMTVTSGLRCLESYTNSNPLGSLVRTCLESSIWHSTRCLLTWKRRVTKHNASIFQLAVSMPRTSDSASLFWPTLTANGFGSEGHRKMLQAMVDKGLLSAEDRRRMICGYGGQTNPNFTEWLMGYEQQFTKLIPTPIATDYKGGCLSRCWMPSRSQNIQVERERERRGYDGRLRSLVEVTPRGRIGPMNPEWVEWLMGYPIGWTALNV